MYSLNEENLKRFVKDNLFLYLDEFQEKLSKQFNINKQYIKVSLIDGECFIKVAGENEVVSSIVKMEKVENV